MKRLAERILPWLQTQDCTTGLQQGRPSGSTMQGLRTWSEQEDAVKNNYIYKIYTYINEKDLLWQAL